MKNLIYAGTNTSSAVNVGGIIPISTINKRFNRKCATSKIDLVGNAVAIATGCQKARYNAVVSVTFTGATVGEAQISLYQNGVAIPFATGTQTLAAVTDYTTITFPASILAGNCSTTSLTIVNTGDVGITVYNVAISVVED